MRNDSLAFAKKLAKEKTATSSTNDPAFPDMMKDAMSSAATSVTSLSISLTTQSVSRIQ